MDNTIDLLQIKIENAKKELSEDTVNAIAVVDWRAAILGMRQKHGYNFEQLGNLELETELVLCGLLRPEDYSKELENRMKISKMAANELVNEMNDLVFKKIREELIKNTERPARNAFSTPASNASRSDAGWADAGGKKMFAGKSVQESGPAVEKKESLPILEKLELNGAHPILAQKLSSTFQAPTVKTDHSLENITKKSSIPVKPGIDPYREIPE